MCPGVEVVRELAVATAGIDVNLEERRRTRYYSIGGLGGTYFAGKILLLKGKVIVVL